MEFKKINPLKTISIIFFIMALFFIFWIFYLNNNYDFSNSAILKAIIISLSLAIIYLVAGIGLWKRKKYGRNLGIVITIFFTAGSLVSFLKMIHFIVLSLLIINFTILLYLILSKTTKNLE
jgi:uncharacterized membrane protein (DUF2068 family)